MLLEICEDVLDEEWLVGWTLQCGKSTAIILRCEERAGRCEKLIENAIHGIMNGLQIGYASVMVKLKISDVTLSASDRLKFLPARNSLQVFVRRSQA